MCCRGSNVTKEEFQDMNYYSRKGYPERTISELTGREEKTIRRCLKAKTWDRYQMKKKIHALEHRIWIGR